MRPNRLTFFAAATAVLIGVPAETQPANPAFPFTYADLGGVNDTIDGTRKAFWTPTPDANGTLGAFTVVARDNGGLQSAAPVAVRMPPSLTRPISPNTSPRDKYASVAQPPSAYVSTTFTWPIRTR